ncbi:hypothetical protein EIN_432590 [Entamoeba invadens IP1]|uniref:Uncharacterized protein n=1 Tax=Entamoeba invadens IP1 TaxID=370355 RepID=A0A0A1UGV2_ENTIV|nr:hypothetical protein EIN_432590 [Entamoeba invadens IP1]ELP93707.1 hypothetical protein EIN_432590 [Entamoeba invadens IP1]|eukprot:XP_004260478.1 hypothetical protein EIN_432590 [Entamoeba invadens IP1]
MLFYIALLLPFTLSEDTPIKPNRLHFYRRPQHTLSLRLEAGVENLQEKEREVREVMQRIYDEMTIFVNKMKDLKKFILLRKVLGIFTQREADAFRNFVWMFEFLIEKLEVDRITERRVFTALLFIEPMLDVFESEESNRFIREFYEVKHKIREHIGRGCFSAIRIKCKMARHFEEISIYFDRFINDVIELTENPLLINSVNAQQAKAKMRMILETINKIKTGL